MLRTKIWNKSDALYCASILNSSSPRTTTKLFKSVVTPLMISKGCKSEGCPRSVVKRFLAFQINRSILTGSGTLSLAELGKISDRNKCRSFSNFSNSSSKIFCESGFCKSSGISSYEIPSMILNSIVWGFKA